MSSRDRTEETHVTAARRLVPTIEAATRRIETERVLPGELLSALHDARLFHMLVPASVGGEELDVVTFFHVIETLAAADASTAWCVGQGCGVSMAAAYLKPEVAREVFGGKTSVVASGPNTPQARAVKTEGGYRVTGKWMYASGSRHSQWLGGHCTLYEADGTTPVKGANGRNRDRTMLFPKAKATIIDTWQVMGLRGTGSDNYEVEDIFVPQDYTFTRDADDDRRVNAPLYSHFTGFNMFGLSFSAVGLGIARAALRDFITLATTKAPQSTGMKLCDNAVIQSKVGQAEAQILAARAFVLDVYAGLWNQAVEGKPFSLADRARMRMASTYAANQARGVVDFVYNSAGGTAIFESKPFERRFRDINCASQQGQSQMANFETVGQVLLGVPPKARV
jgi:alkylation response protein AidB-like acyl-CoA dehydrogenase